MDEVFEVAVVDDEDWVRRGLAAKLARSALPLGGIRDFASGEEFLRYIDGGGRPDIAVCDIRMPGMDGLDLCSLLRGRLPELRVIICSGYGDFDYARRAIKTGVSEYLLKPVDEGEFLGSLRSCMEALARARRALGEGAPPAEAPPGDKAGIVRAVAAAIDRRFAEYLTLDLFAEEYGINPSYLSTVFKELMGVNFQTYLSTTRIRKAKDYLAAGALTLGEVAARTGFSSGFYFSRAFKKIEGRSPREFRGALLR
jgi:two-component system response regulator YesN